MPEKQLKAFTKVNVESGKISKVAMALKVKDLAYYNIEKKEWVVEPGEYKLMVGSSSRDIRQTVTVNVN